VRQVPAPLPCAACYPRGGLTRVDRGRDLLRRVPGLGTLGRPRHPAPLRSGALLRARPPPACSLVGKLTPCLPSAEPPGQPFQTFGQSWGVEPPHSPYNPLKKDRRGSPILYAAVLSRSAPPRCPKPSLTRPLSYAIRLCPRTPAHNTRQRVRSLAGALALSGRGYGPLSMRTQRLPPTCLASPFRW
jgi:hypothetical protein